jgi:cytochrome c-type biogenesis protein CcmF
LVLEAISGDKISVGAPFFNATFVPLAVPLLLAIPFGPLLAWKRGDLYGAAQRLVIAAGVAIAGIAATFAVVEGGPILAPFAFGLAVFVMAGAVTDIADRTGLFRMSLSTSLSRAKGLPRSAWGTALAHFGVGLTLAGVVGETMWGAERIGTAAPGQVVSLRGYDLTFEGLSPRDGANYREFVGKFSVRRGGEAIAVMEPSKRIYPVRDTTRTESALMTRGVNQLYLSLGDESSDGATTFRLYHKPLVILIWTGALFMFAGGAVSLSDRRLRVGAPKPARHATALRPAE